MGLRWMRNAKKATGLDVLKWPSVYVLHAERSGAIKVGISKNVASRAAAIQTGNADDICVFYAERVEPGWNRKVESAFHAEARKLVGHIRGEWCSMDPVLAVTTIKRIIRAKAVDSAPHEFFGIDRGF